jgi:aryl-alcohol dehydrogenase (NADP+)
MTLPTTKLGQTGLTVSRLVLGTMTFGLQTDEETSIKILDTAAEAGINFLDTADVYPLGGGLSTAGRTEEIIGRWLKGKRDGKIKNAKDLYVYNFFPIAAGKSDDYVLQTKGLSAEKIARANPVFNKTLGRPVNTPLTVGDLSDYYQMKGMI